MSDLSGNEINDLLGRLVSREGVAIGDDGRFFEFNDSPDLLRIKTRPSNPLAPFRYGTPYSRSQVREDQAALRRRFDIYRFPVRKDWPEGLRIAMASRLCCDPSSDLVDVELTFRPEYLPDPDLYARVVLNLHPAPHFSEVLDLCSKSVSWDLSDEVDEIEQRVEERLAILLRSKGHSMKEWREWTPAVAKKVFRKSQLGAPRVPVDEFLQMAIVVVHEGRGGLTQRYGRGTSKDLSESALTDRVSRMKEGSNHVDKLLNPLVQARGPKNNLRYHFTAHAEKLVREIS